MNYQCNRASSRQPDRLFELPDSAAKVAVASGSGCQMREQPGLGAGQVWFAFCLFRGQEEAGIFLKIEL
jgi:hypothetical protein